MSNGTEEKVLCQRCEVSPSKYLPGSDDIEVCHNCRKRIKECVSYVAIGQNCWGRGQDATKAKAECVKASGKRKGSKFRGIVYRIVGDDRPFVDGYGSVCYFGKSEVIERVK